MRVDNSCCNHNFSEMKEMMHSMKNFRSGKANLSKDDLVAKQETLASKGFENKNLSNAIDSFDEIDTNGDGISKKELKGFGIKLTPGSFPPGMLIGKGHMMKSGIPKEYTDDITSPTEKTEVTNENGISITEDIVSEDATNIVTEETTENIENIVIATEEEALVVDGSSLIEDIVIDDIEEDTTLLDLLDEVKEE